MLNITDSQFPTIKIITGLSFDITIVADSSLPGYHERMADMQRLCDAYNNYAGLSREVAALNRALMHDSRITREVLFDSSLFCGIPNAVRENKALIRMCKEGKLPGCGIARVTGDYYVVEHDGKETIMLGKKQVAEVVFRGPDCVGAQSYVDTAKTLCTCPSCDGRKVADMYELGDGLGGPCSVCR